MQEIIKECFIDALGMEPTEEQINEVINKLPAELQSEDEDKKVAIHTWVNENINDFL